MSDKETIATEKRQRVPKKNVKSAVENEQQQQEESEAEIVVDDKDEDISEATVEENDTGKKAKKTGINNKRRVSATKRAGLYFSVPISRKPLTLHAERVGKTAPIFLAGVMEYLLAEILDLSQIEMRKKNSDKRILMTHHIKAGLNGDEELFKLFTQMYGEDFNFEDIEEQKNKKVKREVESELHFKQRIPKELREEIAGAKPKKKKKSESKPKEDKKKKKESKKKKDIETKEDKETKDKESKKKKKTEDKEPKEKKKTEDKEPKKKETKKKEPEEGATEKKDKKKKKESEEESTEKKDKKKKKEPEEAIEKKDKKRKKEPEEATEKKDKKEPKKRKSEEKSKTTSEKKSKK